MGVQDRKVSILNSSSTLPLLEVRCREIHHHMWLADILLNQEPPLIVRLPDVWENLHGRVPLGNMSRRYLATHLARQNILDDVEIPNSRTFTQFNQMDEMQRQIQERDDSQSNMRSLTIYIDIPVFLDCLLWFLCSRHLSSTSWWSRIECRESDARRCGSCRKWRTACTWFRRRPLTRLQPAHVSVNNLFYLTLPSHI